MRRVVMGLVLAGCSYQAPPDSSDGPGSPDSPPDVWFGDYAHRKSIAITSAAALDVPVSIVLADAELAGVTGVVFVAGDTVLPFEIVGFDPTGALEAWVRVSLAPPTTVIQLYYDGPEVTPSTPWDGYAGVWHMNGANEMLLDSTPAAHHVIAPDGDATPAKADGIVGGARVYDGNDHAKLDDPADGSLDFPDVSFSYALWVNVTASLGGFDIPFHKGGSSNGNPGYDMELGTGDWNAELNDQVDNHPLAFGNQLELEGNWVQLVAVVDRTADTFTTYTNGVAANQLGIGNVVSIDSDKDLELGRESFAFRGTLDEVRVFREVMTDARIDFEYRNATDRDAVLSIGAQEDRPR